MAPAERLHTADALIPPTQALQIDQEKLAKYLSNNIQGYAKGCVKFHVLQFAHGQSNPTYLIQVGQQRYVLRKKPPGKLLPSAHAVDREYQVLAALGRLQGTSAGVPVPRVLSLCTDASVLGTPFYLMDFLDGIIFLDPNLPGLAPQQRTAVYSSMVHSLAKLHNVCPRDVGLQGYGRPENYCQRQVARWGRQYDSQLDGPPLQEMVTLRSWLSSHVPPSDADGALATITHGDFRADNLVYSTGATPQLLGILDWELSTLGNPWADLAYNCMPYVLPSTIRGISVLQQPLARGIPPLHEYVQLYCAARGVAQPSRTDFVFYLALSLFRIAAILAGVGARARMGNASSRIAKEVGAVTNVQMLAAAALSLIAKADEPPADALHPLNGLGLACVQPPADPVAPAAVPAGLQASARAQALLDKLKDFMAEHIYPKEELFNAHARSSERWTRPTFLEPLKAAAQRQGLWNLWLPATLAAQIRRSLGTLEPALVHQLSLGPGLSNLEYAHLAQEMGRVWWASEVFNCSAPDTGNMEVLAKYGSPEQQQRWLVPLLEGRIRSCFAMTEPQVASSDATNIGCSIQAEGQEYVINGHKWWISGAMDPHCAIMIVMGKTDTSAPTHKQQSMVLVPFKTPGVKVLRPLQVFGYDDAPHGHAELMFSNVRVPASNMILGAGRGFEIAQGRLGPGRLHHCMRAVGMGQRALEIMAARALDRRAFGGPVAKQGAFQQRFAQAVMKLHAARLVVLDAALALDLHGNKAARDKIAIAKVFVPNNVLEVIDAAIQVCGGAGVGEDLPLSLLWAQARTLRIADGPDDVHMGTIAQVYLRTMAKL